MSSNFSDAPSWVPSEGQSLDDLIARVEAATGPDRQLDATIAVATNWKPLGNVRHWIHDWEHGFCLGERDGYVYLNKAPLPDTSWAAPEYTASLDAALALVERVRPGEVGVVSFGGAWARADFINAGGVYLHGTAKTPALALILALLRALQAKASADGTHDGSSPKTLQGEGHE